MALQVRIDPGLCRGYANCIEAAPEVFDLGDDDVAFTRAASYPDDRRAELERAVRMCPARAISLTRA